jgi:hypothetical protein
MLIQHTTSLLRSIWEHAVWRGTVFNTFENWVLHGASRRDVRGNLHALLQTQLTEQTEWRTQNVDLEQVNWDQMTEFLCTCFYRKRFRRPFPNVPSDDVWVRLVDHHSWGPLSLHPQQDQAIKETAPVPLVLLEQKLLRHGGRRMVYRIESDLEPLLERGEAFDGPTDFVPGKLHYCHTNVAQFWMRNREALAIVTGYALSEDGLWRQHSWLLRRNPTAGQCRVIETTIRRIKYFGFILNDSEIELHLHHYV